ncbi:MAG: hypothetical protein OEM38_04370 [Gammaproteobacteria bacterium]|nr:hypothetical protein [Gammaproteobacteria bacterium]
MEAMDMVESGGMDWMKIISALFLVAMLVYLIPRAKQMMEISAQAENKDWMGAIIPLIAVVGFVVFLVSMV